MLESLPTIVVGIRTAVSLSVIIVVVTEMLVGAKYGLGVRAAAAQSTSATPTLYAAMLVVGLIGLVLNVLLVGLERRIGRWKYAS
jgi:NitT/TauT family transport system permease protein